jgi:tetraacyldisaccharide 4'-kinase
MNPLLEKIWYEKHALQAFLIPFSWVYQLIVRWRRWVLESFCQVQFRVPVIVVGNLTAGGVGKTPLVMALAKRLSERGLKVGIVSRGYKAAITQFPYEVKASDDPKQVGDEPLLLAQKTKCPVVIAPKRALAVAYLLEKHGVEVVLSDDGLQHYRMGRSLEVLVVDGQRGLGNGLCFPAGPLREPASRLKEVDFVVVNAGSWDKAYPMRLQAAGLIHLKTGATLAPKDLEGQVVAALAGIGNPKRFYQSLRELGLRFNAYTYPDHYAFRASDLCVEEPVILMTEKDAVKCREFDCDKIYYLPVEAVLNDAFWDALWAQQPL